MNAEVNLAEKQQPFDDILGAFCKSVDEFRTIALISSDGLLISNYSKLKSDEDAITAMVASFHHLTETTLKEFNNAHSREIIITSSGGILIMINIPEIEMVLYIYADDTPKLGYLLYQAREFKKSLVKTFE